MRAQVMERDSHRCRYCGSWATELDHVIPFSRPGGFTIESNLVAACVYCNRSKGDRTPDEWRRAQAIERLSQALAHRRTRQGRIEAVVSKRSASRPPAYLAELLGRQA